MKSQAIIPAILSTITLIPLFKLSQLPPSQKLRKAANLIRAAEKLLIGRNLDAKELDYYKRLLAFLLDTGGFSPLEADTIKNTQDKFLPESGNTELRRLFNNLYQILLTKTGRFQADWDFYDADGILDPAKRQFFKGMQVYLEDIRSPYNVGSMFRAAESFGAEKIWLSPFSASPRHKRAERTAMGCVDVLAFEQLSCNPFDNISHVAHNVFADLPLFALETGGTALEDFSFPSRGILIAGSEELGVSPEALKAADSSLGRVSINTWGAKGSLNVSVAFGIVMQAWAAYLSGS